MHTHWNMLGPSLCWLTCGLFAFFAQVPEASSNEPSGGCQDTVLMPECCPPAVEERDDQHGAQHFIPIRSPLDVTSVNFRAFSSLLPNSEDKAAKHAILHSIGNMHDSKLTFTWTPWHSMPAGIPAGQWWCAPITGHESHRAIDINRNATIQFEHRGPRNRTPAPIFEVQFEPAASEAEIGDTIEQSVGILFEEEGRVYLERINFVSYWSGETIEARVSSVSDRFRVALNLPDAVVSHFAVPRESDEVGIGRSTLMGLGISMEDFEWLPASMRRDHFLILEPLMQVVDAEFLSGFAEAALKYPVPIAIIDRETGRIMLTTRITMHVPGDLGIQR